MEDLDFAMDFASMKKKKKKSKKPPTEPTVEAPHARNKEGKEDYDYYELLEKVYSCLRDDGKAVKDNGPKLKLPPIDVSRDGTTKSVWGNFARFADCMNREQQHLMKFVLTELGTSGSLDGSHRLVIKGRFQQKQLETVVRHYVSDYVKCNQCGGNKTTFRREKRLDWICCEGPGGCHSKRSVAAINSGYQAKTRYKR